MSKSLQEIVIISGKGGTGKTSLTASFAHLAQNHVLCDLDVDAPDLHILLSPSTDKNVTFISGNEAIIDPEKCVGCGDCMERCRFDSIREENGTYSIDPLRCEGCKVCVAFCPAQAIDFPQRECGEWYVSTTRVGTMVHAQLFPGEENSGRLVTLLKQQARELAERRGYNLVLCDGAPGIGCPVISSLSGTNMAVVVTEPTPSGRHDFTRVTELCDYFRVKVAVIINKYDLNPDETASIENLCKEKGYEVVAHVPHDISITQAMVERKAITEIPNSPMADVLSQAWEKIETLAGLRQKETVEA